MTEPFFRAPLLGIPVVTDPERGRRALEDLLDRATTAGDEAVQADLAALTGDPTTESLLLALFSNSSFLTACALSDPAFVRDLMTVGPDTCFGRTVDALKDDLAGERDQQRLMKALRLARRKVALLVAVADVTGLWPLERVTQALSDFIDAALAAAVAHLMLRAADDGEIALADPRFPDESCGLFVLAMGKHGARELNYSSDIDLIVFYEPMRVDFRGAGAIQKTFIRITQRLVAVLQERTADGYVCRVDLRLRPDPGSTPLAVTYASGLTYYASRGANWERAAMIKARAAAGDVALGRQFLKELDTFIWRDHLDFWTLREIAAIKRQINEQRGGGKGGKDGKDGKDGKGGENGDAADLLGHNVKLGRGGIREIEFFAQTQQLIYGGRDPYLRCERTVDALSTLAESGCIDENVADDLTEAYEFLRQVEHRLQMVDDQQTQTLPDDADGMSRIAGFMGYEEAADFVRDLAEHLGRVAGHYAALFEDVPADGSEAELRFAADSPDERTLDLLRNFGFRDPAGAYARLRRWRSGCFDATAEAKGQALLDTLMPTILDRLGRTPWPDHGLDRLDWFLSGLPAERRCLSLLSANPAVLELLIEILNGAPALAESLRARPEQLETVVSPGISGPLPDRRFLRADLAETLSTAADADEARQRAADWMRALRLQVAVRTLRHEIDAAETGRVLADIADAVVSGLLDRLLASGDHAGTHLAVVATGAFGATAPVLTSPLSLWFIHAADDSAAEAGRAAARALTSLLFEPGPDDALFTADGEPLVLSHATLREDLLAQPDARLLSVACGARIVAGPDDLTRDVAATLGAAPGAVGDWPAFAARHLTLYAGDQARTDAADWDVACRTGGLRDFNTLVRLWQLRHAGAQPELSAAGPDTVLARLGAQGLAAEDTVHGLLEAHHVLRQVDNMAAVAVGGVVDPESAAAGTLVALQRTAGVDDPAALAAAVAGAATAIRSALADLESELR